MIIGEMQSKLATWSTENKERKFDRLLRLIADRTWLAEAARITLSSSGARTPGVDGVDKEMMEGNLQHELAAIRVELLAGSYMPLPARRVYEYATLEWVDWFNHRRLLEPIGNVPPAELEMSYFDSSTAKKPA